MCLKTRERNGEKKHSIECPVHEASYVLLKDKMDTTEVVIILKENVSCIRTDT